MNKLILLLLLSCATSTSSIDQFFTAQGYVANKCPANSTCVIESWGDVTVVKFSMRENEGSLTFLKEKLKTITLLRPESVLGGVEWESRIRKRLGGSLSPTPEILKGKDYENERNTLATKDGKITIDLNTKGEFQMVHIAK